MWGHRQTLMSERVSLGRRALGYVTGNSEYFMPGPGLVGIAARKTARWAWLAVWRMIKRAVRKGKALGPLWLGVAVWFAAALAHLAARGWVTVVYGDVIGAALLWWWLGLPLGRSTRRRDLPPARVRAWYAAAFVAYASWVVAGAAAGPWLGANPTPGILIVIMAVFQVAWSWHRRVRTVPVESVDLTEVEQMWQRIKGTDGTYLYDIEEKADPRRVEAKVDLIESGLTVADLGKFIPHVAKFSGVPRNNVMLGYLPSQVEDTATLKVVYENPIDKPAKFDESWIPTAEDIAAGIVPFFTYPDGQRGYLRAWYPGTEEGVPGAGGVNSLFTGDIGSGKSAAMGAALTGLTFTGRVWPIAACPQGGASYPEWAGGNGQAAWKAPGREDDLRPIFDVLEFLERLMDDRTDRMSRFRWVDAWNEEQVGLGCWDWDIMSRYGHLNNTKPWPLVVAAIDELWRINLIPEYAAIVKRLLKMGRKAGIILLGATQYPGLEEFNSDQAMRQPLAAGNVFCFRNKDGVTGNMLLDKSLPAPNHIPAETPDGANTKGTMIAESKGPGSSRPNYGRAVWTQRAAHWAKKAAEHICPLEPESEALLREYLPEGQNWAPPREKAIAVDVAGEAAPVVTGGGTPATARRQTNLDRIVEFLAGHNLDDDGVPAVATTGTIAAALNMPASSVTSALSRAAKGGDPRVVDHGHSLWGLSEAARPSREMAGAAA